MRLIFLSVVSFLHFQINHALNVGVGISDITGPAAEIPMVSLVWNVKNDWFQRMPWPGFFHQKTFLQFQMGFAKSSQTTKGIHIRQYSRAFVFEQNNNRNVFVSADCAMMSQLVKKQVCGWVSK